MRSGKIGSKLGGGGLLLLFYFASAVGSRDGSRNPRMGATCAPSLIEKIIINNDRNNNDAAKGRGSWERIRWPDAKFEVTSAKCDLRNEQQREKREESREKREERSEKRETSTIKMRGSKDAMVRSQNGGMAQKRVGP